MMWELSITLMNSDLVLNIENFNLLLLFFFFFSVDIYFEIFDDANLLADRGANNPVVGI